MSTPEFIPEDPNSSSPAEIPITPTPREPAWGVVEIVAVISFTLGAMLVSGLVGLWLAPHFPIFHGATRTEIANSPLYLVPAQAAAYLLAFAFMRMLITLRSQHDFWGAIRWNLLPLGDMVTLAFSGVVLALGTQLISHFLPIPKELPVDKYFAQPSYIYLMMAFGILVAPLMEELFFRGLVFPVAVKYLGLSVGTVLTAALFAVIHQGQLAHAWAPLAILFLVGIVLTATRAVTKSVAASWVMHMSYNATLFALLFYATGGLKHLDKM